MLLIGLSVVAGDTGLLTHISVNTDVATDLVLRRSDTVQCVRDAVTVFTEGRED